MKARSWAKPPLFLTAQRTTTQAVEAPVAGLGRKGTRPRTRGSTRTSYNYLAGAQSIASRGLVDSLMENNHVESSVREDKN
jgi:hypothetical protein